MRITGSNFHDGAVVQVGTANAKKVKYKGLVTGSNTFSRLVVKGLCGVGNVGADVVITQNNVRSLPFRLTSACPAQ
jgi:hypothetical protein